MTTVPVNACIDKKVHDCSLRSKVTVKKTYTLPRDNQPWQYRVVCVQKRVYGCGYASGQGGSKSIGTYLSKGQHLYVIKKPAFGKTVPVSLGASYHNLTLGVTVSIPIGKQGSAAGSTTAPTYNKAKTKGYYKAYSHVCYDVCYTYSIKRLVSVKPQAPLHSITYWVIFHRRFVTRR